MPDFKMAMWKYLKHFDRKFFLKSQVYHIFENFYAYGVSHAIMYSFKSLVLSYNFTYIINQTLLIGSGNKINNDVTVATKLYKLLF